MAFAAFRGAGVGHLNGGWSDYTKLVAVYITTFIKTFPARKNIVRSMSDAGIQFDCMTWAITVAQRNHSFQSKIFQTKNQLPINNTLESRHIFL